MKQVTSQHNEKQFCTVDEFAKSSGLSRPTAYQLAHREDFPSIRVGRRILISLTGLDEWIKANMGSCQNQGA